MASGILSSDEEKMCKAVTYKQEGNELFKKKEYKKAIRKYHYALLHVKGIGEKNPVTGEAKVLSDTLKQQLDETKFGCYNNLAACMTKTENWEKVIDYCDKALEIKPDNVKALFRKGQACFNVRDWDKSSDAVQKARKLEPNDTSIIRLETTVSNQLKKYREKEKALYRGMFNK